MKLCPECGYGLWNYNHEVLTCKFGHKFTEDGTVVSTEVEPRLVPAHPIKRAVQKRGSGVLTAAVSGGLVAALIEAAVHLL